MKVIFERNINSYKHVIALVSSCGMRLSGFEIIEASCTTEHHLETGHKFQLQRN